MPAFFAIEVLIRRLPQKAHTITIMIIMICMNFFLSMGFSFRIKVYRAAVASHYIKGYLPRSIPLYQIIVLIRAYPYLNLKVYLRVVVPLIFIPIAASAPLVAANFVVKGDVTV